MIPVPDPETNFPDGKHHSLDITFIVIPDQNLLHLSVFGVPVLIDVVNNSVLPLQLELLVTFIDEDPNKLCY